MNSVLLAMSKAEGARLALVRSDTFCIFFSELGEINVHSYTHACLSRLTHTHISAYTYMTYMFMRVLYIKK